jgi:hypothetical protein
MTIYKILFSTFVLLLCGCSARGESGASRSGDRVSVSIHGVNYTADPFEFSVVDPRDEKNNGGGEHIGPYAAGGIVCCFKLPAKWSPGTVIEVESRHWLSTENGEEISAIEKKHTVELPAYANGKAGELWVLRKSDGGFDIVSSDLQPDHPQWPGKIKGWPVASREFMLERWELERKNAESGVQLYRGLIAKLEKSPESTLGKAWAYDKENREDEIKLFSGSKDPAYMQYLIERYKEGLRWTESRLAQIMRGKP